VRVIVPTKAVADDAIRRLELPADRIEVIGEAAAPGFGPRPAAAVAIAREKFGLPDRYLMWVGGMRNPEPRKRIAALSRAKRTMPLVLVGAHGRWASELSDVLLTGEVSDDDLAAIYTGAHALIFPSDDEGFGLPPVEALACGTPVAASDVPAVREVLGARAILRDVDDLDGLVQAAEAATRPAPEPPPWTWADAAAATWQVYDEAAHAARRWRGAKRRESNGTIAQAPANGDRVDGHASS
jgi:alpha-1,3-rhamnosyl/mannosyltransferase